MPCADNINAGFAASYLFSLETQHTIGYGGKATTEQCPPAVILMALQSIIGVIISTCMAGIIFAKFTIPKNREKTITFSKNAVVTMRNGALYMLCRFCDLRKSSLLEPHVRMVVIKKKSLPKVKRFPTNKRIFTSLRKSAGKTTESDCPGQSPLLTRWMRNHLSMT